MSSIHILKFKIAQYTYGLDLKYLIEVGKIKGFFKIPSPVKYFEGLFNLRGNILPVINLGVRLGLNYNIPLDVEKKFIFLNDTMYSFLIIVDEVIGVKDYSINELKSEENIEVISNIIIDENEVVSIVDVKKIILLDHFKFSKKFIFKSIHTLEDIELEEREKEKEKVSFAVFKIKDVFFAINSKFIIQLIHADNHNLNFYSLDDIVFGEIEYENKIFEVINFEKLLNMDSSSKSLSDYFIAIIEKDGKYVCLTIPEKTEFIEIEKDRLFEEISFFNNFVFVDKVFKYKNQNVRVLNIDKLIDFLLNRKALKA